MKKILSIVLTLCLMLTFVGCAKKAYKQKPAEFSVSGLSITLTKAFEAKNYDGYTACYDSRDVAVFVLKESYELKGDFKDLTLDEYAELVYKSNVDKKPTFVTKKDGVTYMEYEFINTDTGETFKYLAAMYKGADAFWLVQFSCAVDVYNEYFPYFISWAKTVNLSAASGDDGGHQEQV